MRHVQRLTRLLAAGVLLTGLSVVFAQDPPPAQQPQHQKNQRDSMAGSTLIGCLNKDASGAFMLTDESTGTKTAVTGAADLEKHSANHRVSLTGSAKTDANGKSVFEVTKITHVSDTCKAP